MESVYKIAIYITYKQIEEYNNMTLIQTDFKIMNINAIKKEKWTHLLDFHAC